MNFEFITCLILFNLGCVLSELSLNIIFITESQEPDLAHEIGKAIKYSEKLRKEVKVNDFVVQVDRENEDEGYRQLCSYAAQGVSIIIDLSWSQWQPAVQFALDSSIPIIQSKLGDQQLLWAINEYLEVRNATDAAILLNGDIEVDKALYHLIGNSNVRVWVHSGLNIETAKALKSMRPEPNYYILVGDNTFITDTYKRAVKEKLVRRNYSWNLVLTDYSLSHIDLPHDTPVMILSADHSECCKLLGRDDCSCPVDFSKKQRLLKMLISYIAESYFKLEIDLQKVKERVNCERISSSEAINNTRQHLYRLFAEDTDNNETLFYWDEDSFTLNLRSRFRLSSLTPNEGLQELAVWSPNEEFKLAPGRYLEPMKLFFRIGTTPAVPWVLPKLDEKSGEPMYTEDGEPIYEGYCIDLIEELAEKMDFDYEIVTPKSGTFGKRLANGSWDGLVGDLIRGETEFAVSALSMTAEREEVIDFVAPYFEQTGILIVIRKPTRKTSLFKFMTVLRTEVWMSIVAALVLTGVMIWLLDKYSPYSARNNPHAYPYPCREFTLKESFWFALTSFTPQGGGEAPKALSGRTLVAAYWLFVVLMLATFTANLAAFLTVERMQTPVSSLEQLARQSRINYTVVEGSTIHQYFINMKFAEDTLYRVWKEITLNATSDQSQYRIWDYPVREQYGHILLAINASGPVPNAKAGFQQVDDHTDADFAFIHDSAEIRYELTKNCNLTEVGEVFAEQPYAIAVQQGSRLQEELSRALLDLQKDRFLENLNAKYWNDTARKQCPDADETEGITLESLGGVFIATLFGLGLAMLTLAWEVFYYKRKEKNTKISNLNIEKPKQAFVDQKSVNFKMAAAAATLTNIKRRKKRDHVKKVTIGDTFRPVQDQKVAVIDVDGRRFQH